MDVFQELFRDPYEVLVRHWNWKSAIFSSAIRAAIFLFTNLSAGWRVAGSAMLAEFLFRPFVSGCLGSLTQAFRWAQPVWAVALILMVFVPATSQLIELAVHWLHGTPKLMTSMLWSLGYSGLSTSFNFYAMRHGAMVVNAPDAAPLPKDIRRIPGIIAGFVAWIPLAVYHSVLRRPTTRK
jgi:hypothetical protein